MTVGTRKGKILMIPVDKIHVPNPRVRNKKQYVAIAENVIQRNVFFRGGEVSVGVTYMTGTLVKLGQRLAAKFLGEKDQSWLPYFFLWTGLVSGALVGSVGYGFFGLHALWASVILSLALTLFSLRIEDEGY